MRIADAIDEGQESGHIRRQADNRHFQSSDKLTALAAADRVQRAQDTHSHKFAAKNVSMVTGHRIHACFMMPALREEKRQIDEEMQPNAHLRRISMRMSSIILLAAVTMPVVTTPTAAAWVHRYKTEEAAKERCPKDEIVWGSSRGIYYPKESHLYGKSRGGAYVCAREAFANGWRKDSE